MKEVCSLKGFAIAVLDKGFVYVGDVEVLDDWVVITNSRNIRKWGTTRGLGELALKGPTENTVLDDVGTVRAPKHALTHIIETDGQKWKN
jgi:hypothetical protein